MTGPALVIMAAGMGSRYGGLKQIDPIGPNGEIIMDYSIYDAIKAGFNKVVFIIKEENYDIFRDTIGKRIEDRVETAYAFQSLGDIPQGFEIPQGRERPWGTGHAVLSCRRHIDGPFVVINADDFYGRASFETLYTYLMNLDEGDNHNYAMPGFILKNTLTDHGHVSRGVCEVDDKGFLVGIKEHTKIKKFPDSAMYKEGQEDWKRISQDSIVSMNMWGFTPSIFNELETGFSDFLNNARDLMTAEFFLPNLIGDLLKEGKIRVRVLPSKDRWYGITYREDKAMVEEAVRQMVDKGVYPYNLLEG